MTSQEYGVFSDEGLLEGDIYSMDEARKVLLSYGSDAYIGEVCPCGSGEEKDFCDTCDGA